MKKNINWKWIKNGAFALVLIILFATGKHKDVIAFGQRGLLLTGLMNPDVEQQQGGLKDIPGESNKLTMVNAEGQEVTLEALRGKVVFLNIWATWCPPCIAEMPGIDKLYRDMPQDKIAFVMLSEDADFEKAKNFVKRKGYDFPIYTRRGYLPSVFRTGSIPATFVIDPEGEIVFRHTGIGNYDTEEFSEFLKGL